ncbi:MAG: hypothetical protein ACR2RF_19890 [Geminicoccaceae bacterium]
MDDDFLFVEQMDAYRSICISTLNYESLNEEEIDGFSVDCGYFIYEVSENPLAKGISVLAKAASFEAAMRLVDLWRSRPTHH